jgi:polyhydroxyalkanoate synthesis regulator phasin
MKFDHKALREFLKIDEDTLKSEREAGKTMVEIAAERGISEQQLKDFHKAQMAQHVEQMIKEGRITAEQAEKMKERMANHEPFDGKGPGKGMMGGKGKMGGHPFMGGHEELLTLLKLDKEAFKSEVDSGKSLLAIAEKQGVSKEQLVNFFKDHMTKRMNEAVAAGKMTAEQAQERQANMLKHIEDMLDKAPMKRGR